MPDAQTEIAEVAKANGWLRFNVEEPTMTRRTEWWVRGLHMLTIRYRWMGETWNKAEMKREMPEGFGVVNASVMLAGDPRALIVQQFKGKGKRDRIVAYLRSASR